MSRIGKQPIQLPQGVSIEVQTGKVKVKGPKGELVVPVDPDLKVVVEDNVVRVTRPTDSRRHKSLHGLTRTLIANAVEGVSKGFVKELEIKGIGYRAKLAGKNIELNIGFSHPVVVEPPEGITFEVPEPTKLRVSGIDKQLVGQVAANIRAIRPPDAYHGKGIRYAGEVLRLKPGKAGTTK
ncbi:50S ribosomal protein L6 [Marinithermus hydrothermalis]|uniref:Large ribosomal subunit protein uL6 n=1 Tax=Marinithermus hydrothermalis (strain DSM 14884 / JCM 11576 / T1) TaxID=869210 RepID=F2NMR2_MARHT|nr:50S ribosomal protein L6 [Marinithermus hydrothermalis]AEB12446.1 ribosomal protein L6 [Marinithermus hydrothermalis DSM 14884]